jgi:hypothetical protein
MILYAELYSRSLDNICFAKGKDIPLVDNRVMGKNGENIISNRKIND